jgi:hypothetical protein
VECGLNAVNEPLARTPDALKRAAQVYHLVDSTGNALGAFESVYGKTLPTFTYEEQAEALLILSGLDSCGNASATAPGDIALLLSGQPGSGTDTGNTPAKPTSDPANTKQTTTSTSGTGTSTTQTSTPTTQTSTPTTQTSTPTTQTSTPTTPTMTPDPPPASPPPFRNCAQAFAAGVHDIPVTDRRYRRALDRDSDGTACELNGDDMAGRDKPGNSANEEAQKHQMEVTPQARTSPTPTRNNHTTNAGNH